MGIFCRGYGRAWSSGAGMNMVVFQTDPASVFQIDPESRNNGFKVVFCLSLSGERFLEHLAISTCHPCPDRITWWKRKTWGRARTRASPTGAKMKASRPISCLAARFAMSMVDDDGGSAPFWNDKKNWDGKQSQADKIRNDDHKNDKPKSCQLPW